MLIENFGDLIHCKRAPQIRSLQVNDHIFRDLFLFLKPTLTIEYYTHTFSPLLSLFFFCVQLNPFGQNALEKRNLRYLKIYIPYIRFTYPLSYSDSTIFKVIKMIEHAPFKSTYTLRCRTKNFKETLTILEDWNYGRFGEFTVEKTSFKWVTDQCKTYALHNKMQITTGEHTIYTVVQCHARKYQVNIEQKTKVMVRTTMTTTTTHHIEIK